MDWRPGCFRGSEYFRSFATRKDIDRRTPNELRRNNSRINHSRGQLLARALEPEHVHRVSVLSAWSTANFFVYAAACLLEVEAWHLFPIAPVISYGAATTGATTMAVYLFAPNRGASATQRCYLSSQRCRCFVHLNSVCF